MAPLCGRHAEPGEGSLHLSWGTKQLTLKEHMHYRRIVIEWLRAELSVAPGFDTSRRPTVRIEELVGPIGVRPNPGLPLLVRKDATLFQPCGGLASLPYPDAVSAMPFPDRVSRVWSCLLVRWRPPW